MTSNSSSPSCQWRWTTRRRVQRDMAGAQVGEPGRPERCSDQRPCDLLVERRRVAGAVGGSMRRGRPWALPSPFATPRAMSVDPIALAHALIACPSVTPARGEVFDVLEAALTPIGFKVHRWVMGEPPDGPTENMVAIRGLGAPHFGFAGHLDVVPPGEGWTQRPVRADHRGRPADRPRRQRHEERHRRLRRGASRGSSRPKARSRCSSPATRKAMPPTARRGSSTGSTSAASGPT